MIDGVVFFKLFCYTVLQLLLMICQLVKLASKTTYDTI